MLKIRLQMTGRRNDRHFRIIVAEHTVGPKSGKYIEKLGFINPRTKEKQLNADRAKYWISVGAKPTDRVFNMLVDLGVVKGPKRNVLPKKTPIVSEDTDKTEVNASGQEETVSEETSDNEEVQEENSEKKEEEVTNENDTEENEEKTD